MSEPVMVHRAADGTVTLEWARGQREALVSRPLLDQTVADLNALRAALRTIANGGFDPLDGPPKFLDRDSMADIARAALGVDVQDIHPTDVERG